MSDTERAARLKLVTVRAFSAAVTVSLAVAAYELGGPHGLALAALVPLAMLPMPVGSVVSLVTAWSGYEVSSCPNCPVFGFRRMTIQHETCAVCGTEEYQIGSTMNGWTHHVSDEAWTCSLDCASEYREEVDADA